MKALKEEVSIYWLYWYKSVCGLELLVYAALSSDEGAQEGGTQFTGFTGTRVQILTQLELQLNKTQKELTDEKAKHQMTLLRR
jgi:hypothetical protein